MRLLFTSDLHGDETLFRAFARELGESGYSCGVISGDLMTHFNPEESQRLLAEAGTDVEDFIDEIDADGSTGSAQAARDAIYAAALKERALRFRTILQEPGIPVLLILGNDDGIVGGGLTWPDSPLVRNINQSVVTVEEWSFVGYQFTPPFVGGLHEKPEEQQEVDLSELEALVDGQTILVTHGPPRGVLDGDGYGSIALRDFLRRQPPFLHLFGHIHECASVRWPYVNGAFPRLGHFYSIDLDARTVEQVGVVR